MARARPGMAVGTDLRGPGASEPPVPPEGSSGTGMLWVGKGCLVPPVAAVPGVACLPSGGGWLLLVAVPSAAIALCLPLAPRGAAGELAEKGAMGTGCFAW